MQQKYSNLREIFEAWRAEREAETKDTNVEPPPRYDDVFFMGLNLDTLEFSEDILEQAERALAVLRPKVDANADTTRQNAPVPNGNPAVWLSVIEANEKAKAPEDLLEAMRQRHALGIARYGVPLQAFNGRSAVRDLFEELLDARAYVEQVCIEQDYDDTWTDIAFDVQVALEKVHAKMNYVRKPDTKSAVTENTEKTFADLVREGQELKKEFIKRTKGMRCRE